MPPTLQRLTYIDGLRAIALFGILMAHAHNFYNFGCGSPSFLDFFYQYFIFTKSALLFALLFGVSFALQMQRSLQRAYDFRLRFAWRLCLLFCFGVLHTFFYCGDILMIFAILGFIPLLTWNLSLRCLALLSLVFLMNPIALCNDLAGHPHALLDFYQSLNLSGCPNPNEASWCEIARWNATDGLVHSGMFMLCSNRLCAVIGMFLVGELVGKSGLLDSLKDQQKKVVPYGFALWLMFLLLGLSPINAYLPNCFAIWSDIAYTCAFAAFVSMMLRHSAMQSLLTPLAAMGKMTLTCYLMQSLVMTFFLCNWGLGLLPYMQTWSMMGVGVLLYAAQLIFCVCWLKSHQYGPCEYLWRKLTRIGMKSS